MKRTKERFGKLESYNNNGQSGLKVFDGEDLEYQDRSRLQQLQQKTWVEQQKYEKELRDQQERHEEKEYAEQTLSINRMRSLLEADHEQKRKDMNRQMMEMNKRLADEKRNREMNSKYNETQLDIYNINEAEQKRSNVYSKLKDEIEYSKSFYSGYGSQQNTNGNFKNSDFGKTEYQGQYSKQYPTNYANNVNPQNQYPQDYSNSQGQFNQQLPIEKFPNELQGQGYENYEGYENNYNNEGMNIQGQ